MTGRVAELEHTAAAAESPGSRGATLAAAEGAARVARARAASLAADAASLSAESGALASASARLAARAEAEEAEAGSAVATLRCARASPLLPPFLPFFTFFCLMRGGSKYLALYAHFTQLSWDAGAGAGRAKGRVVDAAAGDVRFFDEDEAALSPAQLAARLWGVVQGGA